MESYCATKKLETRFLVYTIILTDYISSVFNVFNNKVPDFS
jgi:hypothetical protein